MPTKVFKLTVEAETEDQLPISAESLQDYLNETSIDGESYKVEDYSEQASG